MIANTEKAQIKQLLQSPQWTAAQHLADELCDKIAYDSKVRNNEWDTLKNTLVDDGKIQGIRQFISELFKQAQQ